MKKGNTPLINGIILGVATVYLVVFFSLNSMWNAATVFIIVLIAALTAFQFFLYFKFFKENK